jgi:hypothetical protein
LILCDEELILKLYKVFTDYAVGSAPVTALCTAQHLLARVVQPSVPCARRLYEQATVGATGDNDIHGVYTCPCHNKKAGDSNSEQLHCDKTKVLPIPESLMRYLLLFFWLFVFSFVCLPGQQKSSHLIEWSTYAGIGSENSDNSFDMVVDSEGNVIIATCVGAGDFSIATPHAFQPTIAGGRDFLITKFSRHGILLWGTYYGGSGHEVTGDDDSNWLAVDSIGNIFLAGKTYSDDFPVTPDAFRTWGDIFLVKFSPAGERLWATRYGGNGQDSPATIAVDKQGNPVITGSTTSSDLPAQDGFMPHPPAPESGFGVDSFIARFSADGKHLWSTYYGGERDDYTSGVAVNHNGDIVIVGNTESKRIPVSDDAFQPIPSSIADGFVAAFDSSGLFQWGTYYGSRGCCNVVVAPDGDIIVAGIKWTLLNPDLPGANAESFMQYPNDPYYDLHHFLFKLSSDGKMRWATYTGGVSDGESSLAVSGDGRIGVMFGSKSDKIPRRDTLAFPIEASTGNIYFAEFSPDGKTLLWGTYYVPAEDEHIAFNPDGDIIVGGWIQKPVLPVTEGAYQEKLESGTYSFFITQFGCKSDKPVIRPLPPVLCGKNNVVLSAPEGFNTYLWRPTGDTTRSITVNSVGTYRVYVSDSLGCFNVSEPVTVIALPPPVIRITTNTLTACEGDSIRLEAKRSKAASVRWSTGDTIDVIYIHTSGTYSVVTFYNQLTESASTCQATDSIVVKFYKPADIQVSTTALVFISNPCTTAVQQPITLTNTSDEPIRIVDVIVEGSNEISIVSPGSTFVMPANSNIEVTLQYDPVAVSTSAVLRFHSSPCGYTYTVELTGKISSLTIPDKFDLGCVVSCLPTENSSVTITNTGSSDIVLDAVEIPAPFTALLPAVTLLPAGRQTSLAVGISTSTAGIYEDNLVLRYHTGNCAVVTTMSVRAIVENLTISTAPAINFGEVIVCNETARITTATMEITGSCTHRTTIKTVQISGPFSTSLQQGNELPAGRSEFTVVYTPEKTETATGSLILVLEPCGTTVTIPLGGTALDVEYAVDDNVSFPVLNISQATSSEQTFVFSNTSLVPMTIDNFGCLAQPFEVITPSAAQLPVTLQPGEPLSIRLKFFSGQIGNFRDTLCINGSTPCTFTAMNILQASAIVSPVDTLDASTLVEIPVMRTQAGTANFPIPLILTDEKHLSDVGASAFRTTVYIDTRFFKPDSVSRGTFTERRIGGTLFIDIEAQLSASPRAGDTLLSIIGTTLAGNSRSTPVVFDRFEWIGAVVEEQTRNGRLELDICFPQGLQTLHRTEMYITGEQPSREELTVDIRYVYRGAVLELWSLTGQKILSQPVQNDGEIVLPVGTLSTGIYRLIMSGPFDTISAPVLISR